MHKTLTPHWDIYTYPFTKHYETEGDFGAKISGYIQMEYNYMRTLYWNIIGQGANNIFKFKLITEFFACYFYSKIN